MPTRSGHGSRQGGIKTAAIRTHLLMLVLAVAVPLMAALGYDVYRDMQLAVAHAKKSLRTLAEMMVGNTGRTIANARRVLEQLASRPEVRLIDATRCDPLLQELRMISPDYANVVVTDTSGVAVCPAPAQAASGPVNMGDTAWFQDFARVRRFSVGAPYRTAAGGKWLSVLSVPISNERAQWVGAIHLFVDVNAFDPQIPDQFLPADSRFGFFRNDGILVWRNADPEGVIGTRPDAQAARQIVATRDGAFEGLAVDGVARFFSVVPMPEVGWVVFVGVPTPSIYADAKRNAVGTVALAVALVLVLLGMATALARRITRPIGELERAARAVHQGDLAVRALEQGPREIAAVAREFNAMVAFQQRSDEQLRAFLENSAVVAWLKDLQGRYVFVSENYRKRLGFTAQQVLGQTDYQFRPKDIADDYRNNDLAALNRSESFEVVERAVNPDGSVSWWLSNKFAFSGSDGQRLVGGLAVDITERKLAADLNDLILQTAMDAFWLVGNDGRLLEVNATACLMLGYSEEEMLCRNVTDIDLSAAHADRRETVWALMDKVRTVGSQQFEAQHRRKDGTVLDVEVSVRHLAAQDVFPAFVRDVTARKQAEQSLRLAATVFESQEGMYVTDGNKVIQQVNRAFTQITGFSKEDVIGQTTDLFKSGRHDEDFYAARRKSLRDTGAWAGEIWSRRKNGEIYPQWLTITVVKDEDNTLTHFVCTLVDITGRKAVEEQIRSLAFYDSLTKLPNRRLLLDRLHQALVSCARTGHKAALLYVDLDNFKNLNDTQGHDHGDLLLTQVSARLIACVREGDTVARLGGDEFVMLLEGLSASAHEAATQVEGVGVKVLGVLNQPYDLNGHECHSTPSMGATLITDQCSAPDELMKQADMAMYEAKAAGRNTLRFFDPDMQRVVTARAAMEKALREGLRAAQLVLHYQPQVDQYGQTTGAEALVRWQHPHRGTVAPGEFIPLAEATGLILPLGHWVLETACQQLAIWARQADTASLSMAVNVSVRQFRQPDFVAQVFTVLAQTGADPGKLKLELTESLLVEDVQGVVEKMTALKARGVGFSLDDFGTGYSSLSYLKRLPLDQLKIDRAFVRDVLTDANDAAIARTIVTLGQSLGLAVIAEGVESAAQRDHLASLGCLCYQGYFFGRPMPVSEFEQRLRQR